MIFPNGWWPDGWWPDGWYPDAPTVTPLYLKRLDIPIYYAIDNSPKYRGKSATYPPSYANVVINDFYYDTRSIALGGGNVRYYDGDSWEVMLSSHLLYATAWKEAIDDAMEWVTAQGASSGESYTASAAFMSIIVDRLIVHTAFIDELFGTTGEFSGSLTAATITASSAVYSADGHIGIYGDATSDSLTDGLIFSSYDQKAALPAAGMKFVDNIFYNSSTNFGMIQTLRRRVTSAWDTSAYTRIFHSFASSSFSLYLAVVNGTNGGQIGIGNNIIFEVTTSGTARDAYFNGTSFYSANLATLGTASDPWSAAWANEFKTSETSRTAAQSSFSTWFTPAVGEWGIITYSDTAAGGTSRDFWVYVCDSSSATAVFRLAGGSTYIQASGAAIQARSAGSYTMVFKREVLNKGSI